MSSAVTLRQFSRRGGKKGEGSKRRRRAGEREQGGRTFSGRRTRISVIFRLHICWLAECGDRPPGRCDPTQNEKKEKATSCNACLHHIHFIRTCETGSGQLLICFLSFFARGEGGDQILGLAGWMAHITSPLVLAVRSGRADEAAKHSHNDRRRTSYSS